MKLAISNLAWDKEKNEEIFKLLENDGIHGIEIAPAKVFDQLPSPPPERIAEYVHQLETKHMSLISLQAFLFGRNDLQLFNIIKRKELLEYTKNIILLAEKLKIPVIVYGAPKSRNTAGKNYDECYAYAKEFFKEIGDFSYLHNLVFCIEPNPPKYDCNFIINAREGSALVREVDSPGFGLHLDTACMSLALDDMTQSIKENSDILRHFHISEPNLSDFSAPTINHAQAALALKEIKYEHWVSIEMTSSQNSLKHIETAIAFVKKIYLQ